MSLHDVARESALLSDCKTLETLFTLTCAHGEDAAAIYLEDGVEKKITFDEYRAMADDYAAYLADGLEPGGYVAISMDTCKEWFPTFWGVIRSGHDALLIDAALSDEMVRYLLKQAECKAMITARRRALDAEIRQIDAAGLFAAPKAVDFEPTYGDGVALCTSGTTGTSRIFVYNGEATYIVG